MHDVDKIFDELTEQFHFAVPELLGTTRDSRRIKLKLELLGSKGGRFVDYDQDYLAFNQAFFFKNLYKCLLALENTRKCSLLKACPAGLPVLDIGSGAGTFSIAWSAIMRSYTPTIELFDNCFSQLTLAARIFSVLDAKKIYYRCEAVSPRQDYSRGLRLISYWFCEQDDHALWSHIATKNGFLGDCAIVIDYPNVIERIISSLCRCFHTASFSFEAELVRRHRLIINEDIIRVHVVLLKRK